jgi:hypothetical protein
MAIALASPGDIQAATPTEIRVDLPSGTVRIADPVEADRIVGDLCTTQAARVGKSRPSVRLAVVWSPTIIWTGRFFPSVGSAPAAVDIPDWILYPGPQRCDDRVVGGDALALLGEHGVPVVGMPATDVAPDPALPPWLVAFGAAVAGVVVRRRLARP